MLIHQWCFCAAHLTITWTAVPYWSRQITEFEFHRKSLLSHKCPNVLQNQPGVPTKPWGSCEDSERCTVSRGCQDGGKVCTDVKILQDFSHLSFQVLYFYKFESCFYEQAFKTLDTCHFHKPWQMNEKHTKNIFNHFQVEAYRSISNSDTCRYLELCCYTYLIC